MTNYIVTPDLGDGIDTAKVISVFIKTGQTVGTDDTILELESDKATLEIPADTVGKIKAVLVKKNDTIKPGDVIAEIIPASSTSDASNDTAVVDATVADTPTTETVQDTADSSQTAEPVGKPETITLSALGDGMETVTVLKVLVKTGDVIENSQTPVFEAESDKATVEVPAGVTGEITSVFIDSGQSVSTGDMLFEIKLSTAPRIEKNTSPAEVPKPLPTPPAKQTEPMTAKHAELYSPLTKGKIVPASPKVRRLAREIGIDVSTVAPTGPGGMMTEDDVKRTAKIRLGNMSQAEKQPTVDSEPPLPDFSKFGEIETEEMNKIKQVTARHLSMSARVIPMVTQFDEADITVTEASRKRFKAVAEKKGIRLTMTGVLVKAVVTALKEFPMFNASVDIANNRIIYKKYYHIGIAVDTPGGLLVPIIKNADEKSILEISADLDDLSKKAKNRKLRPEEMKGGTFTVSNLGGISGSAFTPIVTWPEVALLGVGKSAVKPVYEKGEFVPKLMMPLSLSYDHRVIDGANGARFTKFLAEVIGDPFAFGFY